VREPRGIDNLRAYYSALPHIEAGNGIWLEAVAKIWSCDKKLLSLLKEEETFHAKK
jgi:hypothetical protein